MPCARRGLKKLVAYIQGKPVPFPQHVPARGPLSVALNALFPQVTVHQRRRQPQRLLQKLIQPLPRVVFGYNDFPHTAASSS